MVRVAAGPLSDAERGVAICGLCVSELKGGHWARQALTRANDVSRRSTEAPLTDTPQPCVPEKRLPSSGLFLRRSLMIGVTQAGPGCTVVTVDHVSIMLDCPLDVSTLLNFLPVSYSTLCVPSSA